MKLKLLAGAALAGVFAAAGAYATPADSGWYGAIDLGGHTRARHGTTSQFGELGGRQRTCVFTNVNFAGFARVGYKISPHFRVELEAGYRPADLRASSSATSRPSGRQHLRRLQLRRRRLSMRLPRAGGDNDTWTAMGNVLFDLLPDSPIDPFIGGGIGDAHVRLHINGRLNGTAVAVRPRSPLRRAPEPVRLPGHRRPGVQDQRPAQRRPHLSLSRRREVDTLELGDVQRHPAGHVQRRVRGQLADAGPAVSVVGAAAAATAAASAAAAPAASPAAASAAAPPPPPPSPVTKEFIVYFPFDQYVLTPDAQSVVQEARSVRDGRPVAAT